MYFLLISGDLTMKNTSHVSTAYFICLFILFVFIYLIQLISSFI